MRALFSRIPPSFSVLAATGLAGLGGYIITIVIANHLKDSYITFAVFWATYFFAIGLLGGVQQEISRATAIADVDSDGADLRPFSQRITAITATAIVVVGFAIGPILFHSSWLGFVGPLVVGVTGSALVTVWTGALYGAKKWNAVAVLIVADVALRLAMLAIATQFTRDPIVLAWLTAIPVLGVAILLRAFVTAQLRLPIHLDVPGRIATSNVLKTLIASAGTAALVSGVPAILAVAHSDSPASTLGALVFSLTLTRAPLVVGLLAIQSVLVINFRESGNRTVPRLLSLWLLIAVVGIVLAIAAWIWGSQLILWLSGSHFHISSIDIGLLTLSSVPTAWLAISGAASLAKSAHSSFALGWAVAAVASWALLFAPLPVSESLVVSLTFGPLAGIAIHLAGLFGNGNRVPKP